MRWCPDCLDFRREDEFVRNNSTRNGFGGYCREHHNERTRASIARREGGARHYHLVRRHGVGAAEVDEMIARQAGLCPVCRRPLPRVPHVDHDHATGRVRGVLCFTCNGGLGNYGDDPDRLERAAAYLRGTLTAPSLVAPGVFAVQGSTWRRPGPDVEAPAPAGSAPRPAGTHP